MSSKPSTKRPAGVASSSAGDAETGTPASDSEKLSKLRAKFGEQLRDLATEVLGEDPGAQAKKRGRKRRKITEECFKVHCSTPRIVWRGGALRLEREYCLRVTCPLEEEEKS